MGFKFDGLIEVHWGVAPDFAKLEASPGNANAFGR
jgi:hypothetical protein